MVSILTPQLLQCRATIGIPHTAKEAGDTALSAAGPVIWNSIPHSDAPPQCTRSKPSLKKDPLVRSIRAYVHSCFYFFCFPSDYQSEVLIRFVTFWEMRVINVIIIIYFI